MTTLIRERLKGQSHDLGDGFMIRGLLLPPSRAGRIVMAHRPTTRATDPSRPRCTAWCSSTSRAFSLRLRPRKPPVPACRNSSKASSTRTSNAEFLLTASCACVAAIAGTTNWSPSVVGGAGSAPRAGRGACRRPPRTWSITSSRASRAAASPVPSPHSRSVCSARATASPSTSEGSPIEGLSCARTGVGGIGVCVHPNQASRQRSRVTQPVCAMVGCMPRRSYPGRQHAAPQRSVAQPHQRGRTARPGSRSTRRAGWTTAARAIRPAPGPFISP